MPPSSMLVVLLPVWAERLSVLIFSPLIRSVKTAQLESDRERERVSKVSDSRGCFLMFLFSILQDNTSTCSIFSVFDVANLTVTVLKT